MVPLVIDASNHYPVAQIDDFVFFIWTSRYYTPGDFEIVAPASESNRRYLVKGNYIFNKTRDRRNYSAGVIEYVKRTIEEDGTARITIKGRFLESLLYRRIIADQTILTNKYVLEIIKTLIDDNAKSPADSNRTISGIQYLSSSINGPKIKNVQYTGKNVGETISELCHSYGLGWMFRETVGMTAYKKFLLYKGVNRRWSQTANTPVIFSDDNGTLLSVKYVDDDSNLVNAVQVAGEGEGSARKKAWALASPTPTGVDRYEVFADARDISSNNGEITSSAYNEMLIERGTEELYETAHILEASAIFHNMEFGVDVGLGDICTIKCRKLGIQTDARIVEVIESIDETGRYSAIPTFEF